MEITARQFGRLEAVGYAMRKYAEKNDVGTVLVGTLEEVLHEIEAADDLHELDGLFSPLTDREERGCGADNPPAVPPEKSEKPANRDDALIEDVRAYAAELTEQGAGLVTILRMVKEHFGLTSRRFAAMLHVRNQSLNDALKRGVVSPNLLVRAADFFGEDGAETPSDRSDKPDPSDAGQEG